MSPADPAPRTDGPLSSRDQVLDTAARLFGAKGYDATSVREIGAALGVSAPALYHHFPSKEELFCATYEHGMQIITTAVRAALDTASEPWDRLEAAAAAHCDALLGSEGYRTIISPQFPDVSDSIRARLVQQRDEYEAMIRDMVTALDLPGHIDPLVFRMQFLGSLNWAPTWYRPGGRLTPSAIARQMVRQLRHGIRSDGGKSRAGG